jgi:hypothetical protein
MPVKQISFIMLLTVLCGVLAANTLWDDAILFVRASISNGSEPAQTPLMVQPFCLERYQARRTRSLGSESKRNWPDALE